jgi:hypothetical protein
MQRSTAKKPRAPRRPAAPKQKKTTKPRKKPAADGGSRRRKPTGPVPLDTEIQCVSEARQTEPSCECWERRISGQGTPGCWLTPEYWSPAIFSFAPEPLRQGASMRVCSKSGRLGRQRRARCGPAHADRGPQRPREQAPRVDAARLLLQVRQVRVVSPVRAQTGHSDSVVLLPVE